MGTKKTMGGDFAETNLKHEKCPMVATRVAASVINNNLTTPIEWVGGAVCCWATPWPDNTASEVEKDRESLEKTVVETFATTCCPSVNPVDFEKVWVPSTE